jgi:hypothetical protein
MPAPHKPSHPEKPLSQRSRAGLWLARILATWLLEKRRTWAHTNGDVQSRFSKDELCTIATLSRATQSYGTSARDHYGGVGAAVAPVTPLPSRRRSRAE